MTEANAYMGYNDAIHRVRSSRPDGREGNALVGESAFICTFSPACQPFALHRVHISPPRT